MSASIDLSQKPLVVLWEATEACDLACVHCRACAQPRRSPQELTTEQARKFIDDVAALRPPIFILTGGDPLKRHDIYHLVEHAASLGLRPAMAPSVTPLLTRTAVGELKNVGLARLALSLDGSAPHPHDSFRGVPGSYFRTLEVMRWANEARLPLQVNTCITRRNLRDLDHLVAVLQQFKVVLWSVFLLVPVAHRSLADLPTAEECEQVFAHLYRLSRQVPFKIKTTEAQHYRRFIMQNRPQRAERSPVQTRGWREGEENDAVHAGRWMTEGAEHGVPGLLPINDGKGFIFVSHSGEVFPSGFLPISAGNVKAQSLTQIYRESPLLLSLRDTANLKGKCRECEFKEVCGGSRARAYAVTGDLFAEDPCCAYQPLKRGAQPRRGVLLKMA
ncbi:MAG TPA: TIGR04053 family radical SAM/SPASM domain-containing protein [Candidatus Angelobacter sp.]|nr:TIGR04053 family radical SAM/SPASM domain-containing protein [Candidatus Angelobacter sp.]